MRVFKRIFYPLMAVLTVVFVILSFADISENKKPIVQNYDNIKANISAMAGEPHSIIHPEGHAKTVKYITDSLKSYGFTEEDTVDEPAFTVQKTVVQDKSHEAYDITNVIIHIPASDTVNRSGQAILFMAHLDSVPMGSGASDDITAVAVLLESARYYKEQAQQGLLFSNDLVFAFVDGEEFGLYGSEAYINEFTGFDNVVERTRFAVNLESRGTNGTLIMFETAKNNFNTIKYYSKANSNVYTNSIANLVYQSMPNGTDFSNVKDYYQGINLANLGGGQNYHTQGDDPSNVGDTYLTQQAQTVSGVIDVFGSLDLDTLDSDRNAVFFTYLNVGTFYYSYPVSYVFSALTVIGMIAVMFFGIRSKQITAKRLGLGLAVFGISAVASAVSAFILYYLVQLIACATGVMDINQLGSITYSDSGIMLGLLVVVTAVCFICFYFFQKLFKIRGRDTVNAATLFLSLLSAALFFVLPAAAFLFGFTALLLLAWSLVTILLDCKYRARFGESIEKLHIEVLIFTLSLPLVLPVLSLAACALGMDMCYVLALLFAFCLAYAIPALSDGFDFGWLVAKRGAESNGTENSENTQNEKEVEIQKDIAIADTAELDEKAADGDGKTKKKHLKHLSASLTGAITAFVGIMVILAYTAFGTPYLYSNLTGKQGLTCYSYDDSLSYVVTEEGNYYEVKDLNAYIVYKKYLDGYVFDGDQQAYIKADTTQADNPVTQLKKPSYENNTIGYTRHFEKSIATFTFTLPETISAITVGGVRFEEFTYLGESNFSPNSGDKDKIILELRTLEGQIVIETVDNKPYQGEILFEEFIKGKDVLEGFSEWDKVKDLDYSLGAIRFSCKVK